MGCFCQKNKITPIIIVNNTRHTNTCYSTNIKQNTFFDKLSLNLSKNILDFLQYRELKEAAKCNRRFKRHSCDVDLLRKFFKNRRSVCEMKAEHMNHFQSDMINSNNNNNNSNRRRSCINGIVTNQLKSFPTFFNNDNDNDNEKGIINSNKRLKTKKKNTKKKANFKKNIRRKSFIEKKDNQKRNMNIPIEEISDRGYGSNMIDSSKLLKIINKGCSSVSISSFDSKGSYHKTKTKE